MKLSNFLALSLLLICPAALGRVKMHTQAELKNSSAFGDHKCDITFDIDEYESLEVYNYANVRVVAELLAEKNDTAIVCFNVFAKNAEDQWQEIVSPVLVPNYTETALVSIGSTEGDTFTIRVDARKI